MDIRMKKVFLYISIGIIIIAIPISIFLVGKEKDIRARAAPATTLSLTPATVTEKAGDEFDIDVTIDPATNQVTVLQLTLVYDPTKLEALTFKNGPLTPSILISQKIDPSGKAVIKVGAASTTNPITTTGTVAVIHMKALAASVSPVSVRFAPDPDTYVSALGNNATNALVGSSPASVTISNADGSQATSAAPTLAAQPTTTSSATLSTELSPTPEASDSAQASPSAVEITSVQENQQVDSQTPVISGKGVPGSTITIVIHSTDPQTATVTVDANGNWVYTPTTPLAPGPHTVEAMATDPANGTTQTTTTDIVVTNGSQDAGTASGSAIPTTGNDGITILLIIIGLLFFVSGASLPVFIQ